MVFDIFCACDIISPGICSCHSEYYFDVGLLFTSNFSKKLFNRLHCIKPHIPSLFCFQQIRWDFLIDFTSTITKNSIYNVYCNINRQTQTILSLQAECYTFFVLLVLFTVFWDTFLFFVLLELFAVFWIHIQHIYNPLVNFYCSAYRLVMILLLSLND